MIVKKFKGMKNLVSDTKRTIEKLNMLGLTKFVTAVLNEEDVNESFLDDLFFFYNPRNQVSEVNGRVVNVNKDALAAALHLRLPPPPAAVSNYTRFLYLFVTRFMLLNPRNANNDVVHRVLGMKAHPERFDIAEFMWVLVENEMSSNKSGSNKKCYYAQHLQCLIRSQHPDLFANPAMESKTEQILGNLVVQGFSMKRLESVSQENVNRYGLSPFVAAVMNEEILNGWFLAELFASYDPEKKVARISGRVVNVNEDALADALRLPPDDLDLGNSSDYANFLYAFVDNFMFLYVGRAKELVDKQHKEVVQKMNDIKVHPELFDFAGFIWWFVENEILKGLNIKECYCGRHLQCLIRSQHPDLFVDLGVAEMDGTEMDDDDDDDDDDEFDDVVVVQEWSDIDDDDDTDTDTDTFDDEFGDDTDDDESDDDDDDDDDDDGDDDDGEFDDDDDDDDEEEEDEKAKQPAESQVCLENTASSKKRLVDSPKEKQSSKRKQVEESKARTSV